MRVLVHGAPLPGADRLSLAVAGLALRGHDVRWLGDVPPGLEASGVVAIRRRRELPGAGCEVVVGGGEAPFGAALSGWLAGVEAMVLDVRAAQTRRWSVPARFAWHSLGSLALIDESEAHVFGSGAGPPERERIGLWPDVPAPATPQADHPDTEVLERACERALARHRRRYPAAAVFLDRDGTLIRERGYLADPTGVELLPGVARALRTLAGSGFPLVVISNQSGIERGYYSAAQVHATMAGMRRLLREQGVELTAIYFCPHAPDRGCACRKPGTGLLERAAEDLVLSPRGSAMIGDKEIDVRTGRNAGGLGLLVRTGYGAEEEARAAESDARPDGIFDDLAAAVDWLLARED